MRGGLIGHRYNHQNTCRNHSFLFDILRVSLQHSFQYVRHPEERLRARFFTDILNELCQSGSEFVFIATTSEVSKVDSEFFVMLDETIEIPAPDEESRKAYILDKLKCVHCTAEAAEYLAKQSEGAEFARIDKLCEHENYKNNPEKPHNRALFGILVTECTIL